jgi:protein-disulfide isomerase
VSPSPASRTSARQRAAELQRHQRTREHRRHVLLVSSSIVVAVLLLIALIIGIGQSENDTADAAAPSGLVDGAIVSGSGDAPVTVTLYEDFQCPACRAFEQSVGPTIDELREAETIRVEQRPLAFLDRASTNRYASRSLNAVGCVVDSTPDAVQRFIDLLFVEQPAEGGAGLSDARLAQIATEAGAGDVGDCIENETFRGWTERMTERAAQAGVNSTPTVLVDGQVLQDRSPQGLREAVQAAASGN